MSALRLGTCGMPGPCGAHCTEPDPLHRYSCYDASDDVSFNERTMRAEGIQHGACPDPECEINRNPTRRIDEVCARLEIDLLLWQRDFLEGYLRGERFTALRGRKQGWSTLQRVYDELATPALIGPDCRDGKHPACDGRAFDDQADEIVDCQCMCHIPEAA